MGDKRVHSRISTRTLDRIMQDVLAQMQNFSIQATTCSATNRVKKRCSASTGAETGKSARVIPFRRGS